MASTSVKVQQQSMTLKEFERFVIDGNVRVFARQPYQIVPCACRDINCHGWRFMELRPWSDRSSR